MNRARRQNGRDYAGIVAVVLAVTLGLSLLVTTIAVVVFDRDLTDEGGQLLSTIGAGLVGALSVYVGMGHSSQRRDRENGR